MGIFNILSTLNSNCFHHISRYKACRSNGAKFGNDTMYSTVKLIRQGQKKEKNRAYIRPEKSLVNVYLTDSLLVLALKFIT